MIHLQGEHKIKVAAEKNSKKIKIFLDMDGVCAFWEKSAAKTLGMNVEDPKVRHHLKNGKQMEEFVGGDALMWPRIDAEGYEWWANLEILPWAQRLYNELKRRAGDDFCFLTSPNRNPICAQGKIVWLQKHFGETFSDFLIGKKKHLCASPNAILVDDNRGKVEKFRKYGGNAFLWPTPFELIDKDKDLDQTFEDLFKFIEEVERSLQ